MLASFGVGVIGTWHHFDHTGNAPTISTTTLPSLTVPILREKFTLLLCNAGTTTGMEGCAEHQTVALDERINHLRGQIFTRLHDGPAKRRFIVAETNWQTYRQSACASVSDVYQGGSQFPVEFAQCEVQLDQQHRADLSEQLKSY